MRRLPALLFVFAAAFGPYALADSRTEIKERMRERLPAITALKTAKTVGEDNKGYLHVLGTADAASKAIVAAENADRKLVYSAIAAKTGATATAVGEKRATDIAKSAAAGVMLQAPDGAWYEKK